MKVSKFFVELSNPSYTSDIEIKHLMFPELVETVYGRKNPSGYINPRSEAELDSMIEKNYFFRYWLSESINPSPCTGKPSIVSKKVPYESLIEDFMEESNLNVNKQIAFSMLSEKEKQDVHFNEHYGSSSTYKCITFEK